MDENILNRLLSPLQTSGIACVVNSDSAVYATSVLAANPSSPTGEAILGTVLLLDIGYFLLEKYSSKIDRISDDIGHIMGM